MPQDGILFNLCGFKGILEDPIYVDLFPTGWGKKPTEVIRVDIGVWIVLNLKHHFVGLVSQQGQGADHGI
jgi:hypothetical protein